MWRPSEIRAKNFLNKKCYISTMITADELKKSDEYWKEIIDNSIWAYKKGILYPPPTD